MIHFGVSGCDPDIATAISSSFVLDRQADVLLEEDKTYESLIVTDEAEESWLNVSLDIMNLRARVSASIVN